MFLRLRRGRVEEEEGAEEVDGGRLGSRLVGDRVEEEEEMEGQVEDLDVALVGTAGGEGGEDVVVVRAVGNR